MLQKDSIYCMSIVLDRITLHKGSFYFVHPIYVIIALFISGSYGLLVTAESIVTAFIVTHFSDDEGAKD